MNCPCTEEELTLKVINLLNKESPFLKRKTLSDIILLSIFYTLIILYFGLFEKSIFTFIFIFFIIFTCISVFIEPILILPICLIILLYMITF